jgi:hypothetical protein
MKTQLSAIDCSLTGIFDYAGIFPPADHELQTAIHNYQTYLRGPRAWMLGSLVIDARALRALRNQFREKLIHMHLSITATSRDMDDLQQYLDMGLPIAMIEIKAEDQDEILRWQEILPAKIAMYVEAPMPSHDFSMLNAIRKAGMRAKLRMGGVVANAFPAPASVALMLKALAERSLPFKATAGLHHPLRSRYPFTYQKDSETGMMHGFINLLCASALVWFGGEVEDAAQLLEAQDPHAWHITPHAIQWRSYSWNADQLQEVRSHFLMSIGSCSFSEPLNDLERLGWL